MKTGGKLRAMSIDLLCQNVFKVACGICVFMRKVFKREGGKTTAKVLFLHYDATITVNTGIVFVYLAVFDFASIVGPLFKT